jgi:hypothetical protein
VSIKVLKRGYLIIFNILESAPLDIYEGFDDKEATKLCIHEIYRDYYIYLKNPGTFFSIIRSKKVSTPEMSTLFNLFLAQ